MSFPLHKHLPQASRIVLGCMHLGGNWEKTPVSKEDTQRAHQAIDAALESGIRSFDHADIYCHGKSESVFGEFLSTHPNVRNKLVIQSKCGIRLKDEDIVGHYDSSGDWIRASVEGSLRRLNTDYLDVLMIHRPDPLMHPEEVAVVFDELHTQGKVKCFGVSNMHVYQFQMLQHFVNQPLIVNQLEMSLLKHTWIEEGIQAGNTPENKHFWSPGQLEHSMMNDLQLQSWGSLAQGMFTGRDVSGEAEAIRATASLVSIMASEYQTSREAIVLSWLMRHPANIQPVIGTTNPERIRFSMDSNNLLLSRNHWFKLLESIRGKNVP